MCIEHIKEDDKMIKGNKRGRCDNCLKENQELVITLSTNMIQGQICIKCHKKLFY